MTPFAAIDDEIERKTSKETSNQLEEVAASAGTPWLYSALFQLRRLEAIGRLVAGVGDLRINEEAARVARLFLSAVQVPYLPTPLVSPISGGSLSITWCLGEKEVKLAFYSDGTANFFTALSDELSQDGPVDFTHAEQIAAPLHWLVQAHA